MSGCITLASLAPEVGFPRRSRGARVFLMRLRRISGSAFWALGLGAAKSFGDAVVKQ